MFCKEGFIKYQKECLNETTLKCPETIKNCNYCYNNKCIECDDDHYLINNQCISLNECHISNCDECKYDEDIMNFVCNDCAEGFVFNRNGVCEKETVSEDCDYIIGCSKCSTVNRGMCYECDKSRFFVEGEIAECACIQGYDLVNRQCLPPIIPATRPEGPITEPIGDINLATNNELIYEMEVSSKTIELPIPQTCENIIFNINQKIDNAIPIKASDNTAVTLECADDASFLIPPTNNKMNINGHGTITLNPNTESKITKLTLDKVIPEGDGLTLKSDVKDLIIDKIQVYGKSLIIGNSDSNEARTTTCNHLNVENRGNFEAKNIKLTDVKIGLLSILSLDDTVNVDESKFYIYYNRSTTEKQYPIQFKNAFPKFEKANIFVKNHPDNEPLPETQAIEKLLIASFNSDTPSYAKLKESCESLKEKYEGGSGFGNEQCINGSDPETNVNLVAEKSDQKPPTKKKNKLSGGAIAGIVIACVVVVAAIIALLVYFLVIKKNNQSTASTQGDSSIAI